MRLYYFSLGNDFSLGSFAQYIANMFDGTRKKYRRNHAIQPASTEQIIAGNHVIGAVIQVFR
ncbi:protein psaE [Yersinia entomophaga]|uniref:Protein psaE n=1 Tax=Yersinia entomophaga TaxID=935293 RepID=A0ABM6BPA5_YERET|nr:protein psaE [Yersinia entomophaga]